MRKKTLTSLHIVFFSRTVSQLISVNLAREFNRFFLKKCFDQNVFLKKQLQFEFRTLPKDHFDTIRDRVLEHQIEGILLIGGFEVRSFSL